ncbi:MAG: hypothetical protein Q8P13_00985 [bacterium]|nr:hypothetical protein [bacterium]
MTLIFVVQSLRAPLSEKFVWLLTVFFFGALPPILVLVYEKRKGKISDWFISNRAERRDVQLAWVFGATSVTALALIFDLPRTLQALSLTFFSLSLGMSVVNFYWKVSVHTAMITLAVLSMVLIYSSSWAFLFLLILFVAWARVQVGAHTWSQTSGGVFLSLIITYFWFNYFGLATF